MKIFYDGLIYSIYRKRPGGISNFFDHLISRVSETHQCLLTSCRPRDLPHPNGPFLKISRNSFDFRLGPINQYIWKHKFSLKSTVFRPNLVHCTFYDKPSIYSNNLPVIYTCYDMIAEKWSRQLDLDGRHAAMKKKCFDRASAIPCISESTRNDLLALYPYLEPKVSVIPLAGELKPVDEFSNYIPFASNSNPYLLYVGARNSYKNFPRLVLAFAKVATMFPNMCLNVVGAPFTTEEMELFEALNISSRINIYPDISDADLYGLYSQALAFVYPSLYEGFGLPLLEAMALGAPVLTSNTSSMPEVVGNAALLFNPESVDSIGDAIMEIVLRDDLREDLRRKGFLQCQRFSWGATCDQYMNLYRMVLG